MANGDLSDGTLALRLVTDHITECTQARKETRQAINDLTRTIWGLALAAITYLIAFGSYYFVHAQALEGALTQTRIQQAEAVREIPKKTADAVSAKLAPTAQGDQ